MGFNFLNLDAEIRQLMIDELENDILAINLYISPRLLPNSQENYITKLRNSFEEGTDLSLAVELSSLLRQSESYIRKGIERQRKVPKNANEILAEGEFNRFYIRAICVKALNDNLRIEVYRAKNVTNPRMESNQLIGSEPDPNILLNDLRNNVGVDTALRIPAGPNSGLSIKLINSQK